MLEKLALFDSMREGYIKRATFFQEWFDEKGVIASSASKLLAYLFDYLGEILLMGADRNDGSKMGRRPTPRQGGGRRAVDGSPDAEGLASTGWAKRCPSGMCDPPAWEVAMAMVGWLLFRKQPLALAMLLQTLAYLRPGELLNIKPCEVWAPCAHFH